ncbi:hypothetical protein [Pseudomonas sp. Sample_14]|jgi:hypothetical protein|uniref:hypothetical protein n=1 Tax=Pseudomonas sp. Sample_14 TaxID=2448262 RepID=UPI001032C7F4|nr:hypothetical protein [Pseudomonas sp. Sample_14]
MIRLLFLSLTSFALSYLSLWGTDGAVSLLFSNYNPLLFVLGALFGALSLAFFNFVEGVMKDVPKALRVKNAEAYLGVIKTLTDLKREVIVNVMLVVVLLVVAYAAGAVYDLITLQEPNFEKRWIWSVLSIRGACALNVLVVIVLQAGGFVTANHLRAQISMNGD